jgi:chromosome partitioning protein
VIATVVLSQKGGVGKTITVANLAAALALDGYDVLMVDADPQADLTASWDTGDPHNGPYLETLLTDPRLDPRDGLADRTPPEAGRLALLPATPALRAQTAPLLSGDMTELADTLHQLDRDFDLALIDTPAGHTVFAQHAIIAAHEALVTVLPGFHELRALHRVLDDLDAHSDQIATDLSLLGVLLLNAPASPVSREYREFLRDEDLELFATVVPRRQTVTNHARHGQPTVLLEPANAVAVAYRRLAREAAARLAAHHPLAPPGTNAP